MSDTDVIDSDNPDVVVYVIPDVFAYVLPELDPSLWGMRLDFSSPNNSAAIFLLGF